LVLITMVSCTAFDFLLLTTSFDTHSAQRGVSANL
jgi:hypothetical protein